jgi:hypothetical protein
VAAKTTGNSLPPFSLSMSGEDYNAWMLETIRVQPGQESLGIGRLGSKRFWMGDYAGGPHLWSTLPSDPGPEGA